MHILNGSGIIPASHDLYKFYLNQWIKIFSLCSPLGVGNFHWDFSCLSKIILNICMDFFHIIKVTSKVKWKKCLKVQRGYEHTYISKKKKVFSALCCGKTYFKNKISYQQRKYYVSKLSKLFKEHLIIISRPLINNLTSGELFRPFDHFFEGAINTASNLSRASHTEQCRWGGRMWRLKMSFPWELSRS